MPEIRFITCGDAHIYGGVNGNNGNRLKRVINLANQAYDQGKLDFIVFVGDIADMSDKDSDLKDAATIISGLSSDLTRYTVAGNHDVINSSCITTCNTGADTSCRFKTYMGVYPEQYYKFAKSGKTFNIIIPGVCTKGASWSTIPSWYFNFNNTNIDKTLPTLVFDHGPVYKFSNWDNFDMYAQNMSSELTKFGNLIGIYAGHVHQESNNMVGSVRQVTNQATQSTDFVGYTRINDDNITDYATIRYQTGSSQAPFVDPFPTPVAKYRCTGTPDYQCVEDPNGPYNSLTECQAACKPLKNKFKVNTVGSQGVLVMKSSRGDHTADEACKDVCNIINNI